MNLNDEDKLVIQKIRKGYSKLTIFYELSYKLKNPYPLPEYIQNWVDRFERADCSLGQEISKDSFDLLTFIFNKFRLFSNGIHCKSYICSFTLSYLNSRYGFKLPDEDCDFLMVLDCYTGEERLLKCTNNPSFDYELFLNNNEALFALIAPNRLLFFNRSNDTLNIHLLDLNFQQQAFAFLDQRRLELAQTMIVFDKLNQLRFMITGISPDYLNPCIFVGQIISDQILLDQPIDIPVNLECQRLIGNTLSGIIHGYNSITMRRVYQYREYALNERREFELLTQSEFEFGDDSETMRGIYRIASYAWHEKVCFIAVSQTYKRIQKIYMFDVKTCKFFYSNIGSFLRVYDLRVNDEDDSLIIMSIDEVYRYPLRPQRLESLCWFSWRRKQMLNKSCDNLKLPIFSKYRSFYGLL